MPDSSGEKFKGITVNRLYPGHRDYQPESARKHVEEHYGHLGGVVLRTLHPDGSASEEVIGGPDECLCADELYDCGGEYVCECRDEARDD